eukprot:m.172710 g.172710  ORF g.172710 m.172710 type:complete len:835 (-) comp13573_c0_seq1:293-2797(-)
MSTNDGMLDLINVVNKVQDAFSAIGGAGNLDLPQIAVVGGQSAGKSSVLENFVGKDFLPRGSGIVTRRPLVLQLETSKEEYGEFLHAKGKKFPVGEPIRTEIEAETDRMTGSNKGISSYPINLKIYSPYVLNLTLIDLPGLTKVAVGDQPADIEDQIMGMIMEYITKESCIILAVSPANSDLANSDALKLAKSVDPDGVRTIGVITKLDLMDEGTDAMDILSNQFLPLRRGYVGVVNRSQKDIEGNKDIKAALEAEKKFFMTHPKYRTIANKMGTPFLQTKLNQQLTNHIKTTLPTLRRTLEKQVQDLERDAKEAKEKEMGMGHTTKNLVKLVNSFAMNVADAIEGGQGSVSLTELSGGARIARVFSELFPFEVAKIELDEADLRSQIAFSIRNCNGTRSGLFTPEVAFESVCKALIGNLEPPCLKACEMVAEELHKIVSDKSEPMMQYPKLRDEVERLCHTYVSDCETKGKSQVELMVEYELSFINTVHPEFSSSADSQKARLMNRGDSLQQALGQNAGQQQSPDTLIRSGQLTVLPDKKRMLGKKMVFGKEYYFKLTLTTLSYFKSEDESNLKFTFKTEGLKLLEKDNNTFVIVDPTGQMKLSKGESPDQLVIKCGNKEETQAWQAALLRAGVYPMKKVKTVKEQEEEEDNSSLDPLLERQVDSIRNLVDQYMTIITKKMMDTVPKVTMLMVVTALVEYVKEDLLSAIYGETGNADDLLEESQEAKQARREIIAVYEASKEALKIITQVDMRTKSEPLPPPVQNNIRTIEVPAPTSPGGGGGGGASRAPPPARTSMRPPPSRPTPGRPAPRPAPGRPAPGTRPPPNRPPSRS